MDRRQLLALGGLAAVAGSADEAAARDWYELRRYELETDAQRAGLEAYLGGAALPAYARLGLATVGVFAPAEGPGPVWELIVHPTADSAATLTERLLADAEFRAAGEAWLEAPKATPPYARVDSWLLRAIAGMPRLERPRTGTGRVFQLRLYESPSLGCGQTKIRMFDEAELGIFRRVGLAPVFFGETIIGPSMPSLVYLLSFADDAQQTAAWRAFGGDPGWQELRARPEFLDSRIIRGIQNHPLRPLACSTI